MIDTNKAREVAAVLQSRAERSVMASSTANDIREAAALLLALADAHDRDAEDAARYRHAVANAYVWGSVSTYSVQQEEPVAFWIKSNVPMDKAGIDAQIDAAMGESNG